MNIDSISSQIASLDRDIATLERDIQSIDVEINRKSKEAASIADKMTKAKDLKSLTGHQKDLARKNEGITTLEKRKLPKSKSLVDKQKKKRDLQSDLIKEEQKIRDKTKKEQKEILSLQQQVTREIEAQKILSLNSLKMFVPKSDNIGAMIESKINYDVFISHASEDKDNFVRPFVESLKEKKVNVWYDEFELKVGDSLRQKITIKAFEYMVNGKFTFKRIMERSAITTHKESGIQPKVYTGLAFIGDNGYCKDGEDCRRIPMVECYS